MRKYLDCHHDHGIVEVPDWRPHCWVNVEEPDNDDIKFMHGTMHVPSDFLDAAVDQNERPRLDKEDGWTLTIIRVPVRVHRGRDDRAMPYNTVPLGIIVNDEIVLTVCARRTELVEDFIAHTHERHIRIDQVSDLILRLLYATTYWYQRYLKDINDRVNRTVAGLGNSISNDDLLGLMDMQKTLVYFNTSIKGNAVLLGHIQKSFEGHYDADLLDDIDIEMQQDANTVDVYTEILSNIMDTYASVISNNVNDIMKKMTGVSIVLMLPTLIASFYGMNVDVGWEGISWAFWIIIVASFGLAVLLYLILRKIHWL